MENLAYLHLAVDFENPNPELKLRSLKELGLSVPNSAWIGVVSLTIAVSVLAGAHNAMAAVGSGSTGSAVTAVQSALRNRGYDIAVDGVYGQRTVRVVSLLQGYEKISVDGVVGPQTASVLGLSGSAYGGGGGGGNNGGGSSTGAVTITASSGVNIRSGPSTGYAIVGGLGYGTRVNTYGSSGGWYQVNGGWIASSLTSAGGGGGGGGNNGGGSSTGAVTITASSGVNIRSGPSTGYGVVGGLGYGTRVNTYGSSGGWYRVNGGWIASSYTSAGGGGGSGGGGSNGTVTAGSGLLIRSGPGTGYGVVGSLGYGASVPIYSSSNGWYRTNGGWVSSSFVR